MATKFRMLLLLVALLKIATSHPAPDQDLDNILLQVFQKLDFGCVNGGCPPNPENVQNPILSKCLASDGYILSPVENKCYKPIFDKQLNYPDSDALCRSKGWHLAMPNSAVVVTLRYELSTRFGNNRDNYKNCYWVGASGNGITGYFWDFWAKIVKIETSLWKPEQPSKPYGPSSYGVVMGARYTDLGGPPYTVYFDNPHAVKWYPLCEFALS